MGVTPLAAAADSQVSVEGLFELVGLVVIVAVVAAGVVTNRASHNILVALAGRVVAPPLVARTQGARPA